MRTREEQIRAIADEWVEETGMGDGVSYDRAYQIVTESEQRVRAEIGDEVKKLRRENVLVRERVSQLFDSYGPYDRPCKRFVMQALDAAREVGND